MIRRHHITGITVALLAAVQSKASDDHTIAAEEMARFAEAQFIEWVNVPQIIEAIRAQNAMNRPLTLERIVQLDDRWRGEFETYTRPMLAEILERPASQYLTERVLEEHGVITEVIIMDMHGLNVAQTAATSDFWQGDEPKYTKTYLSASDRNHVSDIEQGEASNIYQRQISFKVVDPLTGQAIGAATITVNAEYFY